MESYIQSYGQHKTIVDGNVIDNTKWNMIYDGDVMDLEAKKNNEEVYVQLTNDEILKLFEIPPSKQIMTDRLTHDLTSDLNVRPIIVEEMDIVPKKKSRSKKSRSKKSHSKKSHSKKSNSKKSHSKKSHSKKTTPDYLKTIY